MFECLVPGNGVVRRIRRIRRCNLVGVSMALLEVSKGHGRPEHALTLSSLSAYRSGRSSQLLLQYHTSCHHVP